MVEMRNPELVQEFKLRLADRFTSSELVELLDVDIRDLIEEYWERILDRPDILGEVGCDLSDNDEEE